MFCYAFDLKIFNENNFSRKLLKPLLLVLVETVNVKRPQKKTEYLRKLGHISVGASEHQFVRRTGLSCFSWAPKNNMFWIQRFLGPSIISAVE